MVRSNMGLLLSNNITTITVDVHKDEAAFNIQIVTTPFHEENENLQLQGISFTNFNDMWAFVPENQLDKTILRFDRDASGKPSASVYRGKYGEDSAVVGLTGLVNCGNTCYLNSALQCLSNVPPLTNFFLRCSTLVTKADKPSLSQAYFGLLKKLWSSRGVQHSYVRPTKILHAFKIAVPMFRGDHQQDSHEFLKCFMDQLHKELMEPKTYRSVITDVFDGKLISSVEYRR